MMKSNSLSRYGLWRVAIIAMALLLAACQTNPQYGDDDYYYGPGYSGPYSRAQLAQMLAPIALYPDSLLSQILMASTYPNEVDEADRWISRRPSLRGNALDRALLEWDWDPSVKLLCHFPSLLGFMSERLHETARLGNAFLAQPEDVMDVIQLLRFRAYEKGSLVSTKRHSVILDGRIIRIESVDPLRLYVPYYDADDIYGHWWYPDYPPHYWGPPGLYPRGGIFYWPDTYMLIGFGSWSYFNWIDHAIYIDVRRRPGYVHKHRWYTRSGHWHHSPDRRRKVRHDRPGDRDHRDIHRDRDRDRDKDRHEDRPHTDHERDASHSRPTPRIQPNKDTPAKTRRETRPPKQIRQPKPPDTQRDDRDHEHHRDRAPESDRHDKRPQRDGSPRKVIRNRQTEPERDRSRPEPAQREQDTERSGEHHEHSGDAPHPRETEAPRRQRNPDASTESRRSSDDDERDTRRRYYERDWGDRDNRPRFRSNPDRFRRE